jgi:ABC-2 type transport system permease protein
LLAALHWFQIPYAGTLVPLYLGLVIFNFTIVGIGLCVSAVSATMQQALLYCFTLIMPMVLLSGFATPITSMPEPLQYATLLNPVRYGVEFTQRIYLEGADMRDMFGLYWPLAVMAVITLGTASRLFHSRFFQV